MAVFSLHNEARNEVKQHQTTRYIFSTEALWRILSFPIDERCPTVAQLAIYRENGQRVSFTDENIHQRVQEPVATTLAAFLKLCQQDDFARALLHCDVPKYYTWQAIKRSGRGVCV